MKKLPILLFMVLLVACGNDGGDNRPVVSSSLSPSSAALSMQFSSSESSSISEVDSEFFKAHLVEGEEPYLLEAMTERNLWYYTPICTVNDQVIGNLPFTMLLPLEWIPEPWDETETRGGPPAKTLPQGWHRSETTLPNEAENLTLGFIRCEYLSETHTVEDVLEQGFNFNSRVDAISESGTRTLEMGCRVAYEFWSSITGEYYSHAYILAFSISNAENLAQLAVLYSDDYTPDAVWQLMEPLIASIKLL